MLIDLHCHSRYSYDNHLEPEDLMDRALELGLDGVCFTEHFSVEASLPVTSIESPDGFLVLRGVEVATDCGHLLVYGPRDDSWNLWGGNNFLNLSEVLASVHRLGGICVPAHPFRGWESMGERVYSVPGLDALETHNGANTSEMNQRAVKVALELKLPSVGGSDCHRADQVGRAFTEFSNPIRNMEDLVGEIRSGRCRGRYAPR
jgi:predicted metal-dependent phosphoesterase TrpH